MQTCVVLDLDCFLLYIQLCQKDPIMESHSSLKSLILLLLPDFLWPSFKRAPLSLESCAFGVNTILSSKHFLFYGFLNFYCISLLKQETISTFSLPFSRDEQNIIALNCFCIVNTLSHFLFCKPFSQKKCNAGLLIVFSLFE